MAARIPEQGIGRAQVQGAGGEAETVAVPASALRLFLNLLTEMTKGYAVGLIPTHAEWTTPITSCREPFHLQNEPSRVAMGYRQRLRL